VEVLLACFSCSRTIKYKLFNYVSDKVIAVAGLLRGCEVFQEVGDGEVKGKLLADLHGFPDPMAITTCVEIKSDGFIADDS